MLIIDWDFEWDNDKYEINIKKHGFSFEEILDIFDDIFMKCLINYILLIQKKDLLELV